MYSQVAGSSMFSPPTESVRQGVFHRGRAVGSKKKLEKTSGLVDLCSLVLSSRFVSHPNPPKRTHLEDIQHLFYGLEEFQKILGSTWVPKYS